jgi:hypothetical protein
MRTDINNLLPRLVPSFGGGGGGGSSGNYNSPLINDPFLSQATVNVPPRIQSLMEVNVPPIMPNLSQGLNRNTNEDGMPILDL